MKRWAEADALLDATLSLPAEERAALLDQHCVGDPELRELMESLLAADARTGSAAAQPWRLFPDWISQATDRPFRTRAPSGDRSSTGRTAEHWGSYRLVRELGEGGMGRVFLAERSDGDFQRQVAIKTLKGSFHSTEGLWRFERERKVLAALDHPNIARLYDSGADLEGSPFLVMEYVEGEPLDVYCDRRRLGIDERLRLVQTICEAVQVAHQNLLVHRDLKPGNLLVTDAGVPKLIDFGIAKQLETEFAGSSSDGIPSRSLDHTRTGVHPLTLRFASPEQLSGKPVTTASDVYALGLVLYALLCGRPPIELEGFSIAEASRRVLRGEIPAPSEAVPMNDEGARAASDRSLSASELRRTLRGDLDCVVLRALATDPTRRYGSAGALAVEIYRVLHGFPVVARPESRAYIARRWIGRHRVAVAVSSVVLAVTLAFLANLIVANRRAERALTRAERVSEVLVAMLQTVDPTQSQGEEITVREVLEQGLKEIEAGLASEPSIQSDLFATLVRVNHGLGAFETARDLAQRTLRMRLELYGESHEKIASSRFDLGRMERLLGNYEQAGLHLEAALRWQQNEQGPEAPETLETQVELASTWRHIGRHEQAWTLLQQVDGLARQNPALEAEGRAKIFDELGMVQLARGNPESASGFFSEQLNIFEGHFQPPNTHIAHAQSQLAMALEQKGEWQTAVDLYRRAVKTEEQIYGREHPEMASSLNNLGSVYERMGQYREAEILYREVLEIDRRTLGEKHPYFAISANNLALLLADVEGAKAAIPLLRQAVQIESEALGRDNPEVASGLGNLAFVLATTGAEREAKELFDRAMQMYLSHLGPEHTQVGVLSGKMARTNAWKSNLGTAEKQARRALEILGASLGEDHVSVASIRLELAAVLVRAGQLVGARQHHDDALSVLAQHVPKQHPWLAKAGLVKAVLELKAGNAKSCEQAARSAIDILSAAEAGPAEAEGHLILGRCLTAQGKPTAARAEWAEAISWSRQHLGPQAPLTREIEGALASLIP